MNESVQVIVTKYKNRAKQNIPNYTWLVIARVLVSYFTCEHILLKYITKLQVALVYIKLQYYNTTITTLHCYRFISDLISFLLSSFASFLFFLSDLIHSFDRGMREVKHLETRKQLTRVLVYKILLRMKSMRASGNLSKGLFSWFESIAFFFFLGENESIALIVSKHRSIYVLWSGENTCWYYYLYVPTFNQST